MNPLDISERSAETLEVGARSANVSYGGRRIRFCERGGYHSERLACDSSTASRRSMSGEKFPDIRTVVGIQYFSDVSCPTKCQAMVLGAVVLENVTISADELRRIMCDQLPSLPTHFTFVTKER
ncbi:hypothetical protein IscW_ISCW009814 [Ixodes scapularis]|uniref:Uncharacterized protein n=1 Tax=Ixodes scapularis TaxID=6945 RepID=B7PZK2_IXOSC|nr:hypothetical protein IscW_ISCW009814 [Ixodes scapularis]|eukprot:XP_002405320.1 hypothetical protein IscW_ISCW009814 [Ixodes scapularis]